MATKTLIQDLENALGPDHVSMRQLDRAIYSRDVWPRNTIRLQALELPELPEAVVWPKDVEEVRAVVGIAAQAKVPLIPMGAGSGVCGGTVPLGGKGIIVDLKRMNQILDLNEESLTITARPGIIGEILERKLNQKGYTLGHFPSSIYCSSFGGWLSTRAAGQLSARYGKIEDMVVAIEVVLPNGEVLQTTKAPRSATGPGWVNAFVGAEGTMGIITAATCRIWPYPETRRFQAYEFESVEDGMEAIRRMMQAELTPACVRLYDPVDTFFSRVSKIMPAKEEKHETEAASPKKKSDLGAWPRRVLPYLFRPGSFNPLLSKLGRSKLVLTFEGDPEITRLEKSMARGICARCGGRDLGEGPARHWWERRYKVSYAMQAVFDLGLVADTIEVATTWDNLANLYYEMREAIAPYAFVMAHFSHAYPQGCSIYFSIATSGRGKEKKLEVYDRVWKEAMDACVAHGGSISHHHGVGVLKAKWMKEEKGGLSPMLTALKDAIDPDRIMNPGKLGL